MSARGKRIHTLILRGRIGMIRKIPWRTKPRLQRWNWSTGKQKPHEKTSLKIPKEYP